MRIGVVGAGAIGGWIAAQLAGAGHEVSIVARGETLQAIRSRGLVLRRGDAETTYKVTASGDPGELGLQDVLVLAVKGHSLPGVAPTVTALVRSDTVIVPMMNGVPWWFLGDDTPLRSVDPEGAIGGAIPFRQVVGCVVHASSSCPEPGRIVLKVADRLILGEPNGADTSRVRILVALMTAAGIPAVQSDRIRTDLWYKLWGNMTMNPISALTLASADRMLDDELVRGFTQQIMEEARAVGARCGCVIQQSAVERMGVTRQLGAFKTSMLQDVEAGRPIELDALLAAPREIAARFGIPTPGMDALYGLTRLMGASRGIYATEKSSPTAPSRQ
jgi:2-dehydropantoate 2-reductase